MNDNELLHYGVAGMRWGKRKTPSITSSKKKTKDVTNKVKSMSDDELRKAINRMQLEQQYSKLNPEKVKKGKEFTQKILKTGATIASVTTTGLTVYNNIDKINTIINKK